jgi:citrate lyase subunit beta/citryl-CoA lyase/(S)-citramalyl-CoA lyase
VNAPATSDGIRDLVAIGEYVRQPDMVVIPKVESPRDLEMVAGILDNDGYAPELYALVETPRGIEQISSIVRAERLSGVVFGAADYAAIVGCAMGWGPLLHARSALVNAAHAAGIIAIDSPFFDLQDTEGLKAEAEQAKMLGYWTKGAVHPRQLPIIEDAFSPSEEEIAAARAILAAGQESGDGITSVGGRMIGAPFFRAARSLAGPEGSTRGND